MNDIAKGLKDKADKMFSDMSGQMTDAAETDEQMYGLSPGTPERKKYYPQLTIPRTPDYDKQPGDMCHILAVAEVKTVREDTITVEIQKVIDMPADESEDADDAADDEDEQ